MSQHERGAIRKNSGRYHLVAPRERVMKSYWLWSAAVFFAAAAWAQSADSKTVPVKGEVVSSAPLVGNWTVELGGAGMGIGESASIAADNTFEFRSVPPGTHELRVVTPNGRVLHSEYISVHDPFQRLSIHVPDSQTADRSSGGSSISLQQLSHKVPASARKAFSRGEQAAAKGDMEGARTAFVEAVTIDPEFADAYNELGAADSDLKRLPDAVNDFQKAIDLVPDHRLALPNLSIVLAKLNRFHDAAAVARRALRVVAGATAGRIHYVLAASLLAEHGDIDEIVLHFERSADAVPTARITAADLLAAHGRSQDAIRELEEYLQDAPAGDANRPKAEARLAQLRH